MVLAGISLTYVHAKLSTIPTIPTIPTMLNSSSYNRMFIDRDAMVYDVLESECNKILDRNWLKDMFPIMLAFESVCKDGRDVNGTRIGKVIYGYYVYCDSNNHAYVSDAHKEDIRRLSELLGASEHNYYLVSHNSPENRTIYTPDVVLY